MNFSGQWLLSKSSDPIAYLNTRIPLSLGFYLHLNDQVRFEKIKGAGFDLYVIGVFVNESSINSSEINNENVLDWIIGNVGTYCVIKVSPTDIRLYTDPAAMMGVYYSGDKYSSSVNLLGKIEHNNYFQYFSKGNDWFLGDITPFENVKFLLANHSISLIDKDPERFWPREEFGQNSWEQCIKHTAVSLKSSIEQLVGKYKVLSSITGGKDSRLVMAAAKNVITDIDFFTLKGAGIPKDDIVIVEELIKKSAIRHSFVATVSPSENDLEVYDQISGGLAIGARRNIVSSMDQFKGRELVHLNGNLGAIGKRYYWPAKGKALDLDILLSDFSSVTEDKREGLSTWLNSLPDFLSTHDVCNLMYLEQRGGRWIGIGENASSFIFQSFAPFSSRKIFELVCQLPEESFQNKDWHNDLTEYLSPELAKVRYATSARKYTKFLPSFVRRFLKKVKASFK